MPTSQEKTRAKTRKEEKEEEIEMKVFRIGPPPSPECPNRSAVTFSHIIRDETTNTEEVVVPQSQRMCRHSHIHHSHEHHDSSLWDRAKALMSLVFNVVEAAAADVNILALEFYHPALLVIMQCAIYVQIYYVGYIIIDHYIYGN